MEAVFTLKELIIMLGFFITHNFAKKIIYGSLGNTIKEFYLGLAATFGGGLLIILLSGSSIGSNVLVLFVLTSIFYVIDYKHIKKDKKSKTIEAKSKNNNKLTKEDKIFLALLRFTESKGKVFEWLLLIYLPILIVPIGIVYNYISKDTMVYGTVTVIIATACAYHLNKIMHCKASTVEGRKELGIDQDYEDIDEF